VIVGTDSQSVLNMMLVRGTSPTLGDSTNNSRFRFVGADPSISPKHDARSGNGHYISLNDLNLSIIKYFDIMG